MAMRSRFSPPARPLLWGDLSRCVLTLLRPTAEFVIRYDIQPQAENSGCSNDADGSVDRFHFKTLPEGAPGF